MDLFAVELKPRVLPWEPLGMRPVWFAEIESFPSAAFCALLAPCRQPWRHDKTAKKSGWEIESLMCSSGTPCRAFSIAGLRGGLDDERGAPTLKYVELASKLTTNGLESFQTSRYRLGKCPRSLVIHQITCLDVSSWIGWEDVPFEPGDRPESGKATRSGGGMAKPVAMFQSGRSVVVFMDRSERWPGESLMPNTSSAQRRDACLLSQVLEQTSIPQRYFFEGVRRNIAPSRKRRNRFLAITAMALQSVAKA